MYVVPDLNNGVIDVHTMMCTACSICIFISKFNRLNHLVLNYSMLYTRSTALLFNIIWVVHYFIQCCTVLCRAFILYSVVYLCIVLCCTYIKYSVVYTSCTVLCRTYILNSVVYISCTVLCCTYIKYVPYIHFVQCCLHWLHCIRLY